MFRLAKPFAIALLVLAAWETCARREWIQTALLPAPSEILRTMAQLLVNGELVRDTATSIGRVLVGFSLAATLATALGFLTGSSRLARDIAAPLLEVLRPIPPVAFVPISVLWFGIGNGPAFFLVCLGAFFPIYTNCLAGVLAVNPAHREAALSLGASRWLCLTDVVLPSALPYLIAGLKTGLGTAWFCVIVAELVGAQSGLGYMIQLNRLTLQSEKVFAGMVMIGVVGFSMNRLMVAVHRRAVPWKVDSLRA
jgi:ABC-type nitrate/sulfonate/bicarbonate transport system permease component